MGEDIDPLTINDSAGVVSHRGILAAMAILVMVGTVLGIVIKGPMFGLGVLFGGVLAFVNYFWLERSTRAVFDQRAAGSAGLMAAKYILRYVVIGAVLLAIYLTGAFPVAAVILGLAAFAFAVVLQGLKSIFFSSL
jgi:hypothetical protein